MVAVQGADTVAQAAAFLEQDSGTHILGGGTILVRRMNYGAPEIKQLVPADHLDIDGISYDDGRVTLGAAVTMARIR